jgi:hypothetical protein
MSAANTTRWIGIGLLGLVLYGVLTFLSSLDPQHDPNSDYEAWAQYVSTNYYVLKHLFGSILGMIFALFGTFALGAYLSRSRAGGLGLVAMVITVFGYALFLTVMGVATFLTGSTPVTVGVGAVLLVISGGWMAWSVLREPSAGAVGVQAQPRVR